MTSTLNPFAPIFVPTNPFTIPAQKKSKTKTQWSYITTKDKCILDQLDHYTQITLDAIWNEYIVETQDADELEKEIEEENIMIRAAH